MSSPVVGTVAEIWVYPVSSLGGQRLSSAELTSTGIAGDRSWCIVDAETGVPASPEREPRWRAALFLQSRFDSGRPCIGFPDGQWLSVDDDRLKPKLAEHFSFAVEVCPYVSETTAESCSATPIRNRYEPSPVHLVTTASLEHMSAIMGAERCDVRRFRPTILVRTNGGLGFVEGKWVGQDMVVATVALRATEETKRCGMTLIAQPGLVEEPEVLRTVVRHNSRNLGIYCGVSNPGTVQIGDVVAMRSPGQD